MSPDAHALRALRRLLLGILLFGMAGTLVELVLLEHTEKAWQLVPLALLALGLPTTAAHLWMQRRSTLLALRTCMASFVVAGFLGLYWHYSGNVEFEREMYPSLDGIELVWQALTGATPTLAPGAMVLLGLVGLAATSRVPGPD